MTIAADVARLAEAPAEDVLRWTLERFGDRVALVTAFQAEGMVVLDLAHRIGARPRVVTIDTGRLPEETYELIDRVRGRYDVRVEVVLPDARHVGAMVRRHGVNLFYRDQVLRELCCHVRKVLPLDGALVGLEAWVTGLRRGQNTARAETPKIAIDRAHGGMLKVSPIADWSADRVWEYVREHRVPVSDLYAQGYTSIGCAPCTRPVGAGEHERAGRWWWEADGDKECGMHGGSPSARLEEEIAWLTTAS